MKKTFTPLLCLGLVLSGVGAFAQTVTGPSSSRSPYLVPVAAGAKVTSVLTVGDSAANNYRMVGLADGLGAFDNGNGTFTVLMNHEIGNTQGIARAHGSTGAFVSKWVIDKADLSVINGADLIQTVKLWNTSTQSYDTYNASTPSGLTQFGRFCAADLPAVSAFYNSTTGNGTQERIFMNGEESGSEGRGFAHIVTGAEAGVSYELPHLGKLSWENAVAAPGTGDKTVVVGLDDATPGQVYVYIGTKTTTGNDIEKAGLTGGNLYGVSVSGMLLESSGSIPAAGTSFTLVSLGSVENTSGATLNTNSNTAGVTQFLRPEDGAWDPRHPEDFYFVTTNSFTSPSRLWKLHFNDVSDLTLGGTIAAVLDGTEGQKMLDNAVFDKYGNYIIQEDPGGQNYLARTWSYNVDTDVLTELLSHDPNRFVSGSPDFLTIDEEASGAIDMEEILGPGWFLGADQAHYNIPGELVQGGQLFAFFNPMTECAALNGDIAVSGPTTICPAGNVTLTAGDGSSYLWSNGATTRSVTVDQTGDYSVRVSGASGCFIESDTVVVTVKAIPSPLKIVNAAGTSLSFCNGGDVELMVDPTQDVSGFGYQWNHDGNPIVGADQSTYIAATAGNYTVTVSGGAGCSKTSNIKTVTVKPNPVAGFTISGSPEFCKGGSATLHANIVSGYTYLWMNDAVYLGTGDSKLVKTSGNYTMIAKLNGCADTAVPQAITVYELPVAQITTADDTVFCSGDSALLNAIPTGAGYSYEWRIGPNIVPSYNAADLTATTNGLYRVTVTDDKGCVSRLSSGIRIRAELTPAATITALGSTTIGTGGSVNLRANSGTGYSWQWYLDGNPIPGANTRVYTATQGGDYTVEVTKGNCSQTSGVTTVTQLAFKETTGITSGAYGESSFELSAFPNPTGSTVTVSVQGLEEVSGVLYVMDVNGRLMATKDISTPAVSIDMTSYPSAMYIIRYKDNSGRTGIVKVTKQ